MPSVLSVIEQVSASNALRGKQSVCRSGQDLRVPGGEAPRISRQSAHEGVRLSDLNIGRLYPPGNSPGAHLY